ncbi:MAG: DUF3011 domain-containing protein [Luteimonas sp.]
MRRLAGFAAMTVLAALGGCAGYYPAAGYPGSAYPASSYPGGYGDPNYGYPQGYPSAQQGLVRCESQDGRLQRCAADTRGGVRMTSQLSRTDCVQGRNWGYDASGIWVDDGCRAEFATGSSGAYGNGAYGTGSRVIRCESEDGRERHCAANLRGAALQKQVSRAPCVQGRNWRWDAGGIWVKDGCRADFAVW